MKRKEEGRDREDPNRIIEVIEKLTNK